MAGVRETAGEVEGFFFEVEKDVQGAFFTAQPGWIAIGDIARCLPMQQTPQVSKSDV